VPEAARRDPVLYGECLGGALYWNDFLQLAKRQGFTDPRLVEDRPLEVTDPALAAKLGNIRFFSATYRLFKLEGLENDCEDYGQAVVYRGTVPNCPQGFSLDSHHYIETGRVFPVCGNTWRMLQHTRFAEHFDFIGDFSRHYGIFEGCGVALIDGGQQRTYNQRQFEGSCSCPRCKRHSQHISVRSFCTIWRQHKLPLINESTSLTRYRCERWADVTLSIHATGKRWHCLWRCGQ
jgi:hypothetical protein